MFKLDRDYSMAIGLAIFALKEGIKQDENNRDYAEKAIEDLQELDEGLKKFKQEFLKPIKY